MLWQNRISEELKKILKDNLPRNSSILEYAIAKIYLAYPDTEFQFTGLEGCLCLIVNRSIGSLYLNLYEYTKHKKELELEIYTNIEKGYNTLQNNFHSINDPFGTIGISFANKIEAEKMKKSIFYNSILFNINPENYMLINNNSMIESSNGLKQTKSNKEFKINENCINSSSISDLNNVQKIVHFFINHDEGEIVLNVKKEEFDKAFSNYSLCSSILESHKIKLVNDKAKEELDLISGQINENINEAKFIEYDSSRRKSIFPNINKKSILDQRASMKKEYEKEFERTSLNMNDNDIKQRKSLKHIIHMQNRIHNYDLISSIDKKMSIEKIKPIQKEQTKEKKINIIEQNHNEV